MSKDLNQAEINQGDETSPSSRAWLIAPVLITVVAVALRVYRLEAGLWYDELVSLHDYFRAAPFKTMTSMPGPNNHVAYSLLAHLCIRLFGEAEWSLRLPAVIMGALGVPVLYWLAARYSGRWTAGVAAMLLAVSTWHVWLSQDARGYSAMILLCLASNAFLVIAFERPSWKPAALHALCITAAVYFHLHASFTLIAQLMFVAAATRLRISDPRRVVLIGVVSACAVVLLLYLPMLDDMLRFARTDGRMTATRDLSLSFILSLPMEWAAGKGKPWLALPLFVCFVAGAAAAARTRPVLVWFALAPLVLTLLFTLTTGVFIYHRMLSFFIPWYLWFAAWGLVRLAGLAGKFKPAVVVITASALIAINAFALPVYYAFGKQPIKEACEWTNKLPPNVPIYTMGLAGLETTHYCKRASIIPLNSSAAPAVKRGGVIVAPFPFSWGGENRELFGKRCEMALVFESAAYEQNHVYVFYCKSE